MDARRPFLLVGLTGGIATGKSTVSELLRMLGGVIIDADQLAREVVEPGQPALAEIAREFGPSVIDAGGRLDRKAMGALVFADSAARQRLETIVHPRIRQRLARRLADLTEEGFRGLVVFDAPVIVESGFYREMDTLVVVTADEACQLARLMARERIPRDEARRRIGSQLPLAEKVKLADYVIDNSGDRAATEAQVRRVHAALHADLAARRQG